MTKLVVLGAGESGRGAAVLAARKGYDVFVSEAGAIDDITKALFKAEGISFEEGGHTQAKILQAAEIVKSPGIPESVAIVKALRANNIPVIDELEFAVRHCRARLICITGTNGKTTTSLLTYHLLKAAGVSVGLGGNVGKSLAGQLATEEEKSWYVLEVSSFQIDGFEALKPQVAVLLNITPDHLDRYNYDFQQYAQSKFSLLKNMTTDDTLIFNADDVTITNWLEQHAPEFRQEGVGYAVQDAGVRLEAVGLKILGDSQQLKEKELPLRGKHNLLNMGAAILAARAAGLSIQEIRQHLKTFKNAPHRMQAAGEFGGVEYINDSKATNVDSAYYALEAMTKPLIWIAGGVDKGNDYAQLLPVLEGKAKALVCLGLDNEKLKTAFAGKFQTIVEADSMAGAVSQAAELAASGDVVLLSPACASFDLFKNYEDRGRQFMQQVSQLMHAN